MANRSSESSRQEKRHHGKSSDITLDDARRTELEKLEARDIDTTDPDAAEVLDWSDAERGKFYRPIKQQITLRLDKDIIAWFKARGAKYQSRINRALRDHIQAQTRREAK